MGMKGFNHHEEDSHIMTRNENEIDISRFTYAGLLGIILLFCILCCSTNRSTEPEPEPEPEGPKILLFSGYEWLVKSSVITVGPGPNYFSDSDENVWVDD